MKFSTPGTSLIKKGPGIATRIAQAARYTISGITPGDWMSALQPLPPFTPTIEPRQYDFEVGRNLFYRPRSGERFGFSELKALSKNSELVRQAIESRKDQMDALGWKITPKEDTGRDPNDPIIKEIQKFFEKPDGINTWPSWLRLILEAVYVYDAACLAPRMNRGGTLYGVELLDGSTVFPLIDNTGRRPLAPSPAYQQILKGVPKVDFTADELIYAVRNVQIDSPYGYSPTEQVAQSAKTDIERINYQLAYFTEGSVPDAVITMPDGMTPDKVKAYETHFNSILSGNYAERRKIPFLVFGSKIETLKQPPLKDDFDEWLWRKIALAFKMAPTALIKQMNRSSSETDKERSEDEGLAPMMVWVKRIIDGIISQHWKVDDIEFMWQDDKEQDPLQAAQIDGILVGDGIVTINEARQLRGLPDVEGGDTPMVKTASGYVPIDGSRPINAPEPDPNSQNPDGSPKKPFAPGQENGGDNAPGSVKPKVGEPKKAPAKKVIKKKSGLYGTQYR